jgi:flagellar motor component MotA
VSRIGHYAIYAGRISGKDLLTRLVILAGVMGIQAGTNPRVLKLELLSLLGLEEGG